MGRKPKVDKEVSVYGKHGTSQEKVSSCFIP